MKSAWFLIFAQMISKSFAIKHWENYYFIPSFVREVTDAEMIESAIDYELKEVSDAEMLEVIENETDI